jgi:hypothetical protein
MTESPNPGTRRITQSSVSKGLVIQGNLNDTSLPETVQFLQSLRKTGQLALERKEPQQSAGISFVDGRIVHAFCPPLVGERGFYHLLTWRTGRYIFLPNAPARERSIAADTNALLLDGLRRLDELRRCQERLPPRGTVLYRRRDIALLHCVQITIAHLRLWRQLDGRVTIGELLDADAEAGPLLVLLVEAGLATPVPDHHFLAELTLAQTVAGAAQIDVESHDLASRLLIACDGHRSLAEARAVINCSPEEAIAAAEYLLALRLLHLVEGSEAAALLI